MPDPEKCPECRRQRADDFVEWYKLMTALPDVGARPRCAAHVSDVEVDPYHDAQWECDRVHLARLQSENARMREAIGPFVSAAKDARKKHDGEVGWFSQDEWSELAEVFNDDV